MLKNVLSTNDAVGGAVIYDGNKDTLDIKVISDALENGKTVAVKNAKKGQLSGLYPGTGYEVPDNLALFAVKRVPLKSGKDKVHTVVTMIPEKISTTQVIISESPGSGDTTTTGSFSPDDEMIMEEIQKHVDFTVGVDNYLVPPANINAFFGLLTQRYPWGGQLVQNFWSENKGATQTFQIATTQTYYFYLAQSPTGGYQYYVILVQNGYLQASTSGKLCSNDDNSRVFVNGLFTLSNGVSQGALTIVAASPYSSTNNQNPLIDVISLPMQLMAQVNGGNNPVAFQASYVNSVPNPDWGLNLNESTPSLAWTYYNMTGWNALTQAPSDFGDWWAQMYSDDKVISLDGQCTGAVNFDNVTGWSIPANPGNTSLPVNFTLSVSITFEGFANPTGTGNGHHQIVAGCCDYEFTLPQLDLVKVTNSSSVN